MNNSIQKIIFFVAGVAIGSIVTKKILDDKYNKLIDERVEKEVESIKNVFKRDSEAFSKMNEQLGEVDRNRMKRNLNEYKEKVISYGYSTEVMSSERYNNPNDEPEIISSADYIDEAFDNYEREELSYYADGVLATTNGDEMITEQEAVDTIGQNNFLHLREHFGEYDDSPDTVYIRNDETQILYEIFRDSRTYLEVTEE